MLLIYRYIIRILETEFFSQKNYERVWRSITKKYFKSRPISLKDFLKNTPIKQSDTGIKNPK
jgi:hypothetical protein